MPRKHESARVGETRGLARVARRRAFRAGRPFAGTGRDPTGIGSIERSAISDATGERDDGAAAGPRRRDRGSRRARFETSGGPLSGRTQPLAQAWNETRRVALGALCERERSQTREERLRTGNRLRFRSARLVTFELVPVGTFGAFGAHRRRGENAVSAARARLQPPRRFVRQVTMASGRGRARAPGGRVNARPRRSADLSRLRAPHF